MKYAILFYILTLCFRSQGQELYGRYLNTENGLLSKECYDIEYDKFGYLLVGTQYGPMRFDGEKFEPICLNLTKKSRIIYDFEKTNTGEMYCSSSENKIYKIVNDRAIPLVIKNKSQFSPERFNIIKLKSCKNGLLIKNEIAFEFYDFKTKKLNGTLPIQADYDEMIFDSRDNICFRSVKNKIIPSGYSLIRFKDVNQTVRIDGPLTSENRSDYIKYRNKLYVVINEKIYIISNKKLQALNYTGILFIKIIHNKLWLASTTGLYECDLNGRLLQIHFKDEIIGGVVPINKGGLIVSLNQHGLFVCSGFTDRIYQSLAPSYVFANKSTTLIGTNNGELFRYSKNKLNTTNFPKIKPKNHSEVLKISHIAYYQNKWKICAFLGLFELDSNLNNPKEIKFSFPPSFSLVFVSKGIHYVATNHYIFVEHSKIPSINISRIKCIYQIDEENVLLGTIEGVFEFHPKTKKYEPIYPELFNKRINSINKYEDYLIITTQYDGTYLVRNNKIVKRIYSPSAASYKSLYYNKNIYIGCNDAIYRLNVNNIGKSDSWIKIFHGESANFFIENGLMFISHDGNLITKELSYITKNKPYKFFIHTVKIDGKKRKTIPNTIKYDTPIQLNFDVLKFDAEKTGLTYKLEGESSFEQNIEGTIINLRSLPSGTYTLTVYPRIDEETNYSIQRIFQFEIEEPFSQSLLFYFLISCLFIISVFTVRLIFKLRARKRKQQRLELERTLNEYKLLAVKAQVNPHFLSNGLAAIQALILKEDNDRAAQYLAKFSFLMRRILMYSETQFITLKQEFELVDAYLEIEHLRLRNGFKIHKSIELNDTELVSFRMPSLLLQPILENAIWHGLKHKSRDPELKIICYLNESNELVISIADNGTGINKLNRNENHLSKGNQLITERISALNLQFQKEVAFMELESSDKGTTVKFKFKQEVYHN